MKEKILEIGHISIGIIALIILIVWILEQKIKNMKL